MEQREWIRPRTAGLPARRCVWSWCRTVLSPVSSPAELASGAAKRVVPDGRAVSGAASWAEMNISDSQATATKLQSRPLFSGRGLASGGRLGDDAADRDQQP